MKGKIFILLFSIIISFLFIELYFNNSEEIEDVNIVEENIEITEKIIIETKEIDYERVVNRAWKEYADIMSELESSIDMEYWYVNMYLAWCEKYQYIVDVPENIYNYYTDEELDLLFRVVQAEVGDEYTFEEKSNVASVIFNRINDEKLFKNTITEVLTPDQFSTIRNGSYLKVVASEKTILACEFAFAIKDTTDGCVYFESGNNKTHADYAEEVFTDDAGHTFYKLKEKGDENE